MLKATVHIREAQRGRYRVWITGAAVCEIRASFTSAFSQHGARTWHSADGGYWTTGLRYRLDEWLSHLPWGVRVDWPQTEEQSA